MSGQSDFTHFAAKWSETNIFPMSGEETLGMLLSIKEIYAETNTTLKSNYPPIFKKLIKKKKNLIPTVKHLYLKSLESNKNQKKTTPSFV